MKRGLPVVLLGAIISFGSSTKAADIRQPTAIATVDLSLLLRSGPVAGESTKSVSFLSDASIAVGLCRFQDSSSDSHVTIPIKKDCSLTLLELQSGHLQPWVQTPYFSPSESLHLTTEGRVLAISFGKSPAVLYTPDLSNQTELPALRYSSRSGNTVAELTPGGWRLYRLSSALTYLRDGSGLLESMSDEVVVYRSGRTIRTETLDGKSLGSFQLSDACRVRVLAAEKLFVNDCKGPRIVDYNGKELMRFRRLRNWDHFELDSSADGERLLFNHFSGKMSVFRAAGEVLVAFATAGMGASDEADNREQVQVLDINTGESCFDLHQGFAKGSESSSRSAFISPSGQYVAIVAGSSLSIYGLPATCKSKK